MSISYGPNIGIMNGAADGDLYGNAMRAFQRACDAFLQPIVKGYLTNTPPSSPTDGDMYIIGSAPTGSWASYAGYVAKWSALIAAWEFYLPKNGWQFQSNSGREIYRRTGGAWEIYYQEGTWTPIATSFGGSGISFQYAYYVVLGKRADFTVRINGVGLTTTANSSYISAPFTASKNSIGGADNNSVVGGITEIAGSKIYLPTIASTSAINLSGTIFL